MKMQEASELAKGYCASVGPRVVYPRGNEDIWAVIPYMRCWESKASLENLTFKREMHPRLNGR